MTEACDEGDVVACDNLSNEEEAKRAWLANLDAPTWGAAAAAVSAVAEVTQPRAASEEEAKKAWLARADAPSFGNTANMSEEQAKKAWLAKLDAPAWGKAAATVSSAAVAAAEMAEMTAACDEGDV